MTDEDGHRIEAAEHFGFETIGEDDEPGQPGYFCTEAQLIAFAKVCERAGREQAIQVAKARAAQYDTQRCAQENALAGECEDIAAELEKRNAATDAELAPILEAERMKAEGYECPCGRGDNPCPGPNGMPLCTEPNT